MKKINTSYLDSLVSKVLSETLEEKANNLISKIKGDVCECGGTMYEGVCEQCGDMNEGIYDVDDIDNSNEFDYVQEDDSEFTEEPNVQGCRYHIEKFGEDDPVTQEVCKGVNINEALKGRQGRLDKNKNNKIDTEDFKMLRNNSKTVEDIKKVNKISTRHGMEEQETEEGNTFTGALSKARKTGEKDFEVNGKKFETKEGKETFIQKVSEKMDKKGTEGSFKRYCGGEVTKSCIEKALESGSPSLVKKANFAKNIKGYEGAKHKKRIKESYRLTETEMVSMIEKIVLEQKSKEVKDPAEKNNIKGFGGSPRGLEVYKKAHKSSGKENDDNIKDVTKKMKDYLKDGSKGDYDMNPKIFPKGNGELEKMKKTAYEVSKDGDEFIDDYLRPGMQTLDYDEIHPNEDWMNDNIEGSSRTGNNSEWANTGESEINTKLNKTRKKGAYTKAKRAAYNKAPQPVISDKPGQESGKGLHIKTESTDKKQKQISEEFDRMKSLIGYNQKTQ